MPILKERATALTPTVAGNARKRRILVVDDEPRVLSLLRLHLELDGYQVMEARDGWQALQIVHSHLPDVVILDLQLPGMSGTGLLQGLRDFSRVPVIVLSASSDEMEKTYALHLGADDYVTKPFSPRELSSRIKAILRRVEWVGSSPSEAIITVDERLQVDFNQREVLVWGERIKLRPNEASLMYILIENAGWTVPHESILRYVWGTQDRSLLHYIRLYVNYLRTKIEEDSSNPRYILLERGIGYRFIDFRNRGE